MGVWSKWLESLDYEYEVLPSCTRHLSPRSTCSKCIEVCEEKAISIKRGKPVIENSKCNECGICIPTCPVQAIAGIFPTRKMIQNQLVINELKKPTVKELLILYKKGIRTIVGETTSVIEQWKQTIDEVNEILELLNEAPFTVSDKLIEEEEYFSRRELFSLWKNESKSVVKQVSPAKWRFNQNDFYLSKYYRDYQFAGIILNLEKCSLCNACQRLCKNQCFHIGENQFTLNSQGCSSCQLCVDTCPEQAISITEQISRAEEISYRIYQKVCPVCNKTYETLHDHDEKCVACAKREMYVNKLERSENNAF